MDWESEVRVSFYLSASMLLRVFSPGPGRTASQRVWTGTASRGCGGGLACSRGGACGAGLPRSADKRAHPRLAAASRAGGSGNCNSGSSGGQSRMLAGSLRLH